MKTKDFIKMLQEADPEGEGFIRMEGGIPAFAEPKEGYWDGPYSYIDEDGNYVYSTEGYKIDIYCTDIWDFVGRNVDETTTWEEVKNKFKFELGYSNQESKNSREESILKIAKEAYECISNLKKQMLEESISLAVQRAKEGWRFFQDKKVDLESDDKKRFYIYYYWRIYKPKENIKLNWFSKMFSRAEWKDKWQSSCLGDTQGIIKSRLFEKLDNNELEGYYEWVLK